MNGGQWEWQTWSDALFVYVMRCHDVRKIGITNNPIRRQMEVERDIGMATDLEFMVSHPVPVGRLVESCSHRLLDDRKVWNEWFFVSLQEAEAVLVACVCDHVDYLSRDDLRQDYQSAKAMIRKRTAADFNAVEERDINDIILRGPPGNLTATQRLAAYLDWRYGNLPVRQTAKLHGLNVTTMSKRFGERLGRPC